MFQNRTDAQILFWFYVCFLVRSTRIWREDTVNEYFHVCMPFWEHIECILIYSSSLGWFAQPKWAHSAYKIHVHMSFRMVESSCQKLSSFSFSSSLESHNLQLLLCDNEKIQPRLKGFASPSNLRISSFLTGWLLHIFRRLINSNCYVQCYRSVCWVASVRMISRMFRFFSSNGEKTMLFVEATRVFVLGSSKRSTSVPPKW